MKPLLGFHETVRYVGTEHFMMSPNFEGLGFDDLLVSYVTSSKTYRTAQPPAESEL